MVEYMVKSIASNPEEVKVTEEEQNGRVVLKLQVSPDDKGRVIGRQGRVIQSIRMLLRVAAVKAGTRAVLEVL